MTLKGKELLYSFPYFFVYILHKKCTINFADYFNKYAMQRVLIDHGVPL
jgi:hypothetical protein